MNVIGKKPGAELEVSIVSRSEMAQRMSALRNERASWVQHWMDLSKQIRPRASRFLLYEANKGQRRTEYIINSTPVLAARTLAAGMMAAISSPSRPWFRLTVPDAALAETEAVKAWLASTEDLLRETFIKSNIYNALLLVYGDIGPFGVSCIHVEEDETDVIRAYHFPLGSYMLANGERGAVDTVMREFRMTARQLIQKFGRSKVSEAVRRAYDDGETEQWFDVGHAILPNAKFEKGKLGAKGKRWLSVWWELASGPDVGFLRESGFDELPFMSPRWSTTGEDVYGSCPGMEALGDCRALQHLEKEKAKAVDKVVTPPMRGPSSLVNKRIGLLPGDLTIVDSINPMQTLQPSVEVNPGVVPTIIESIKEHEHRINRTFFADLWLMLSQIEGGQMTAREVNERREEKLLQLGPVTERLQGELLKPLIERTFAILYKRGAITPPPEELQGADLRIEYMSIMADAQKLLGTTAVERLTSYVGSLAAAKPDVLDTLDLDQGIQEYAAMLGVPPKMIRPDDAVARIRAQRSQAAQQTQQMQQAQAGASTAQTLSQTDTEGTNALTTMLRGVGAA